MDRTLSGRRMTAVAAVAVVAGSLIGVSAAKAELIYAVTNQNFLTSFDSASPGNLNIGVQITGVQTGELIMGIDIRTSTGVLYGLGSQNRLYTINTTTGVATAVSAGPFAPPESGVEFGISYYAPTDTIRVVSDTQQNFRLNPTTGLVVATDTPLAYVAGDPHAGQDPSIIGLGYDTAASPTLWALDSQYNTLVRIGSVGGTPNSPNTGQLTTIGATLDFVELGGLDFGGSGTAYGALLPVGSSASSLYTFNLTNGQATPVGQIGGGLFIRDIAVVPVPGTIVLVGVGGLIAASRRRR